MLCLLGEHQPYFDGHYNGFGCRCGPGLCNAQLCPANGEACVALRGMVSNQEIKIDGAFRV